MGHEDNYWIRRMGSGRLTRRRFVGGAALLGVGGAGLALVGCGDDDSTSKTPTAAGGGGATDVSSLKKLLDLPTGAAAGEGLTINVGAVLALSESGSYYGGIMSKGIDLAVEQIKALGGPTFKITYKDHKSGNAEAGAAAARELGIAKTPLCLASYGADIGSMLAGIEQYKMLTLDGGGGTGTAFQKKPYFYGTRAITPDDTFPGVYQYVTAKLPNVKKVQLVYWDLPEELINPSVELLKAALAKNKLEYLGLEKAPIGTNDFSTLLARLKQKNADMLHMAVYGLDPGFLMKQLDTSGINAVVMGSEFTPDAAKVAGASYNKYMFAYDFFDIDAPSNPWGKLFVDSFKKKYPDVVPDFYAANFYENMFTTWEIVRRVIAKKGDVNSGDQLNAALQEKTVFPSVYGGDSAKAGVIAIDKDTHTVSKRSMGVFKIKDGKPAMAASFDIGGADFKLVG